MTDDTKGLSIQNEEVREAETEIVQRAINGDQQAMAEIVQLHQRNVYNLGLRLSGSEQEAECVLQETFLKVFEKLADFRLESRLGTWIHRIATNVALMRMRSRKGKYFIPIEDQPHDDEVPEEKGFIAQSFDQSPLEQTMNEELKIHMERAINSLPPNLRTAFVLKDMQDLSLAEIAEETGKSVPAVKADLHRARVRLRKQLTEFAEE